MVDNPMATDLVIEHCAAVADVYCDAWKSRQSSAFTTKERRDFETMAIAAVHIAAAIRELAANKPDALLAARTPREVAK